MMLDFIYDQYVHETFSAQQVADSLAYWANSSSSKISKR
jgi:hypothetical protein